MTYCRIPASIDVGRENQIPSVRLANSTTDPITARNATPGAVEQHPGMPVTTSWFGAPVPWFVAAV